MTRLVYYNAIVASHPDNHRLPGIEKFSSYFKLYNQGVVPIDRSGTIRFPIKTKSLFPIPKLVPFSETYEAVCNARAAELLERADQLNTKLYIFWSGGIDSTTVMVSILKQATSSQLNRVVVLLSEDSIAENPVFYQQYIRGKLTTESSTMFPYLLGQKHVIVNGEHNDQLFGSDIVAAVIQRFGAEVIHKPYDRALFLTFVSERIGNQDIAESYISLFEKLKENAPVPIDTNYKLFWWINFSIKWQTVYTRTLSFASKRNASHIDASYLETYYAPFFNTEKFQLWSMHNPDEKIRDEWRTYKWAAKELIYNFTKDKDYRDNKLKIGSLYNLILQQVSFNFIDENFAFLETLPAEDYYESENDFK